MKSYDHTKIEKKWPQKKLTADRQKGADFSRGKQKVYNHKVIEKYWQREWTRKKTYATKDSSDKPKYYILDMFPYPSGEGLHVGHPKGYIATDIISRMKRMQGHNVLHPMGFDAFGLPAENYAIKTKTNPQISVAKNVSRYKKQLEILGFDYDWSREINTTDPKYYKWTQWIFLKLLEKGLAYESYEPINWCPSCKTGLANEDVEDGKCERCGTPVEKKPMRQWVLRITDYADRLLKDLDAIESETPIFKRTTGTDAVRNDLPFDEREVVVCIVKHWSEDKYLCSEWKANDWRGFITGGVEKGEDFRTTAVREVEEETGYTQAKFIKVVGKADSQFYQALKKVNRFARMTCVYVELAGSDRKETSEKEKAIHNLSWLSRQEMEKTLNRDDMKYFWDLFIGEKNQESKPLLEWPESIKEAQRNWIGKSEGMLFTAPVKDTNLKIQTFSAHFEAFAADTFVVIAPDHSFLKELVKGTPTEKKVLAFADLLVKNRLTEDYGGNKEPEGIFTGRYVVDPVGNGDLPIWIANYALADYGTGIVKCSCHDERDFAFAKRYNLKLKPVLFPQDADLRKKVENLEICYFDMKNGILSEPKEFNGKKAGDCRREIIAYLEKNNLAEKKTTYRIKDWVFSRQRYWGEPIPVFHDTNGKIIPVSEKDLPVVLPKVKYYLPTGTGESPLADIPKWVNVKNGKEMLKRETNTMPQWAGSSWYYLRYMDPKDTRKLVDPEKEKYWNRVDFYVGGAEHATRHLIYARFWHKFLYDIGVVSTIEPFKRLQSVGLIMGEDGRKMSKRFGNVVNPDDIVKTYGADTMRVYEMFMGPFADQIAWSTDGMSGARRFIERVWKTAEKRTANSQKPVANSRMQNLLHKTIKKVTEDISEMRFNTAISALMILQNEIDKEGIGREDFEAYIKLIAPFAPHFTEEIWSQLGHKDSIHVSEWPKYDESLIKDSSAKIAVQINGKVRSVVEMPIDATEEEVKKQALSDPAIQKWLTGKTQKKIIYVKGRVINIIVNS